MANELLTETRGRVLVITLNRPEAKNSINSALGDALVETIASLETDADLTAAIITGAGGGFSAGMDLKEFATRGVPASFGKFIREGCKKPLIAAIEGFALAGGLEIALTCDLLVAARGVKLGVPEVKRGLMAGGGGLFRLPARIPYAVAMEMALTGDPITAERGHDLGLVSRLAEPGKSLDSAIELAEAIAVNAPLAVAGSKQVVERSVGQTDDENWASQGEFVAPVFKSKDAIEGAKAFAEKRAPNWKGC